MQRGVQDHGKESGTLKGGFAAGLEADGGMPSDCTAAVEHGRRQQVFRQAMVTPKLTSVQWHTSWRALLEP